VDFNSIPKEGLIRLLSDNAEEDNVLEMLNNCKINDFGKGSLKSFDIDSKEFMNLEYTP